MLDFTWHSKDTIICSFFVSANIMLEFTGDKMVLGGGNIIFVVDLVKYKIIKRLKQARKRSIQMSAA